MKNKLEKWQWELSFPNGELRWSPYSACKNSERKDVFFVSFSDMTSALGAGIFVQPIISYLELISIGKNFAKKEQYKIDPTQEWFSAWSRIVLAKFRLTWFIDSTNIKNRTLWNKSWKISSRCANLRFLESATFHQILIFVMWNEIL